MAYASGVTLEHSVGSHGHLMTIFIQRNVEDEIANTLIDAVRSQVRDLFLASQDVKQLIREETQKVLETSLRKVVEEVVREQATK